MGGDEKNVIKYICSRNLKLDIMVWNRVVIKDVEEFIFCGVDVVVILILVFDIYIENKLRIFRGWVLENMVKIVEFVKKNGLYVLVNGEDVLRVDIDFLIEFINVGK